MRPIKLACAIGGAAAVMAIASATSFAALPEFLPGSGEFSGKTGANALLVKGLFTISCSSVGWSGELTGAASGKGVTTATGCKAAGVPINSLGSGGGTITFGFEQQLCYVSKSPKVVGISARITPEAGVHLEVPAAGQLLILKGGAIASITPLNESTAGPYALGIHQKGGVPEIEACEGGSANILLASLNGGSFVRAGAEALEASVSFAAAHELMA